MTFLAPIPDFMLANPLYIGATVSFFTVGPNGQATTTLAPLYGDPLGQTSAINPQILDGEGKFQSPVYINVPVIAQITGPRVASHTTGVINVRGTWRGNWASNIVYFITDFVSDPVSGNIYIATVDYTSSSSLTTDIANGNLQLVINQSAIISGGASLAIKVPVQCATTGSNITLSGLQTIDGYTTLAGDRVLVKDQSNPAQNGIYNAAVGAWSRSVDCATSSMLANGTCVDVLNGTINDDQRFRCSLVTPFILGTTPNMWAADEFPNSAITVQFGSNIDAALTAGLQGYIPVPYACTIQSMTLLANQAGSIVIDIWKAPYYNFPPTNLNSICGSDLPTLSNQQTNQDTTLSGWTTQLNVGDVLAFNIDTVSGLQFVTLSLAVART
jgi:hypothetical protein